MASAVDADRAVTNITSAVDPWTVNLPASIVTGNLLIALGQTAGTQTINIPSGWTSLYNGSSLIADDDVCVMWRKADGTEGATFSWDLSATAKGSVIVWKITGNADPATQAPEISTIATSNADQLPDPGNIAPTGGSKDYLFLALATATGEMNFNGIPSGYANTGDANSGTAGATNTNNRARGCSRQATVSSEDPGTFSLDAAPANGWVAFTVAIHPGAPSTSLLLPNRSQSRIVRCR